MGYKLNTPVQGIGYGGFTTLLSGPSAYAPQPRITAKAATVTNISATPISFLLQKTGLPLAAGNVGAYASAEVSFDTVLDTSDSITGECLSSGTLYVGLSAEIDF